MSSTLPPWLVASLKPSHINPAIKVLRERESVRRQARAASRNGNVPVQTQFNRYLPSFLHPKPSKPTDSTVDYYSVAIGDDPRNQHANRYIQLEPYDRTRVVVPDGGDGSNQQLDIDAGRYLNANWVLERFGRKWWIASQAPLPHTSHAFLSLLLQPVMQPPRSPAPPFPTSRIRTVVQLTQNEEEGRVKAHAYFPEEVGGSLVLRPESTCERPPLKITLVLVESIPEAQCIRSILSMAPVTTGRSRGSSSLGQAPVDDHIGSEGVVFQHLLYTSWPDHGVPSVQDRAGLVAFVELVDKLNRDVSFIPVSDPADLDPDPPVIVGCSAGIGRTGAFLALSSLFRSLNFLMPPTSPGSPATALIPSPLGPLPENLGHDQILEEIDTLREQRVGMVQRDEQVLLIYDIVESKCNERLGVGQASVSLRFSRS